ncbi:MAG: 60S ribosomal export protein NMD3 [Promethearchaeota archaeon]
MTRQCPKCGSPPTKAQPFIEGFCAKCYFTDHPLIILRQSPEAKICSRCQAYYVGGNWVHQTDQPDDLHIYELVCSLLDPLFTPSQPASFDVQLKELPDGPLAKAKELHVEVSAQAEEYPYKEQKVVTIPITPALCTQCRQSAGGYFEAVIQIRSSSGKITPAQIDEIADFINKRLATEDLPPASLKLSESRGGFDIKCMTTRLGRTLAKDLADQFGLIHKVSSKVVGRTREGKNLRRDTYSLRFPLYRIGDLISYKEGPYLITGLRSGRYILTNIETPHRETLSPKELNEIDADLLNDEIRTFQIISVEGATVQLMDQDDYSLYDFPRADQKLESGTMISAIEWKNRLVLLPTEIDVTEKNSNE